ncbi:MAG: hypothetical protein KC546_18325 [Anaerolineae bacterium]|nr:hypothetical protein [Anaerolineae bacterium]MCA9890346.1 hypothetical protein [Anaerolineae bacterium]
MATRGNFALVPFGEHIGDNATDLDLPTVPFVGNQSTLKSFNIEGHPVNSSYILVQTYDVDVESHEIFVNGMPLTGLNFPEHSGWETWMVALKEGLLKQGMNTIQIVRDTRTTDDFIVGNVVIHWQEYVP